MTDTQLDPGQDLAARLRVFADWIETRPTIATLRQYMLSSMYCFASEDQWQTVLREAGTFSKGAAGEYLQAFVQVPDCGSLYLAISKKETCERVQTGELEVTREVYPDDVIPVIVTEMEPVYEWVCPDSWLEQP